MNKFNLRHTTYNLRLKRKGQTLIEFALILPFWFFLVFFFIKLCFFLVEEHIGTYIAFMAARSYQVYGNEKEENGSEMKYKKVAKDMLSHSFLFTSENEQTIDVFVDSAKAQNMTVFSQESNFYQYDALLDIYGMSQNQDNYTLGVQSPDQAIDKGRFGILKLTFPHTWNIFPMLGGSMFDKHEIYVPYRLEPLLIPDSGG
ncbi:MAG: hypothetical protein ABIA04_11920 [Pseudomonadota bacterium]